MVPGDVQREMGDKMCPWFHGLNYVWRNRHRLSPSGVITLAPDADLTTTICSLAGSGEASRCSQKLRKSRQPEAYALMVAADLLLRA
jgi:hypothetical protein